MIFDCDPRIYTSFKNLLRYYIGRPKPKLVISNIAEANPNFIFTIQVDPGDLDFTVPTISSGSYNCNVNWGDGSDDDITTYNDAAWTHTYAASGVKTITISGTFSRIYFNNGGSKLKIRTIENWGTVGWTTNQASAFYGCTNLTSIGDDVDWMNSTLTGGYRMFYHNNSLTSLPSGITFSALINGQEMFYSNSLTSLPSGITFAALTNGSNMFSGNSLTSLPSGITFAALINGSNMFYNNSLTSLPSGITFSALTSGSYMFFGSTIATDDYNQMWVNVEANNNNNAVAFHGGNSVATSGPPDGLSSRSHMATTHSWTITDGTP